MGPDTYICLFFVQLHNTWAYMYCQLLLWLTLNLPNLCICMYILRIPPRMAPARPRAYTRISVCVGHVSAHCGHHVCVTAQCGSHVSQNCCKTGCFLRIDNCYGISCPVIRHMWGWHMGKWCKNCSADAYILLPNTLPHIGVVAVLPRILWLASHHVRIHTGMMCAHTRGKLHTCFHAHNAQEKSRAVLPLTFSANLDYEVRAFEAPRLDTTYRR